MEIRFFSFITILFFLVCFSGNAQEKDAKIAFDSKEHDFGKVKEDGGVVSHKFEFTNSGGSPLVINDVKASCGCTTPEWTEKPVMPGKKGYVSVTFNPSNRPGNFNKSIVVRTNGVESVTVLRVKGEVLAKERTVKSRYPTKMGELRLKSNHLPFVKVKHTTPKIDSLPIINTSDEVMDVSFTDVPEYLDIRTKPGSLKPGEEGWIWAKINPQEVDDWGFIIDRFRIKVNGENVNNNRFTVTAKIVEDFSKLTPEERKNAPTVEFEKTTYDFGTEKQNSKVTHTFKFKNTGKRDLKIRKIRATCGCTTAEPSRTVIPPGKSDSLKAVFSTGSRSGNQKKLIYFISNDPENSNVRLTFKGEVAK
ncbi:MAG: DUF1573 domain-containing protein [Bacteroidota bacterium]